MCYSPLLLEYGWRPFSSMGKPFFIRELQSTTAAVADALSEALEAYLQTDGAEPAGSALSQVGDLRGILSGPEDLSANKDYLRKFGR